MNRPITAKPAPAELVIAAPAKVVGDGLVVPVGPTGVAVPEVVTVPLAAALEALDCVEVKVELEIGVVE
jgi:hypothetical protein